MKKRVFSFALAFFMCLGMAVPTFAADKAPEISITWLPPVELERLEDYSLKPVYNQEFNWLTLWESHGDLGWGTVIDLETGEKIEEYAYVGPFSDGLASVLKGDFEGDDRTWEWGYIDTTGEMVITFEDWWVSGNFNDGLAPVISLGDSSYSAGYIDKTGKVAIPLEYSGTWAFADGLARVVKYDADGNSKWGYIDKTGAVVVPLEYDQAYDFSDGLALVAKRDADGNYKFSSIDKTGTPLEYRVGNFGDGLDGLAWVKNETGKCGYIDKTGKVVLPLEYDGAGSFYNGLAPVAKQDDDGNNKYGYIDKTGAIVVPLEYDEAYVFSEGLALVGKKDADGNYKYGYIDKMGKVVIPLEYGISSYDGDWGFSNGLARIVEKDADGHEKYGYIDKTGKIVVPIEYDYASRVYEEFDQLNSNNGELGRLYWVKKGASIGIFESPYYEAEKEGGNIVTDIIDKVTGNSGTNASETPSKGSGFPVMPVVIAVVALGAVAAVLVVKKKKPSAETANVPPAQKAQPPRPATPPERPPVRETPPASGPKFCPNCGKPLIPGVKFCPECGKPVNGGEG